MLIQPEETEKTATTASAAGSCSRFATPADGSSPSAAGSLGRASPNTSTARHPLFDKGRTLYNIDRAAPASRQARRLIVVEGYMDVIALDRAGIAEAVAPNGPPSPKPSSNGCGASTASRSAASTATPPGRRRRSGPLRALPHLAPERTLRFVASPPARIPTTWSEPAGKDAVEALLPAPSRWSSGCGAEVEAAPLDTPEARAGLKQRLIEHTQAIADQRPPALPRRMAAPLRRPRPPSAAGPFPLALPAAGVEEAKRPLGPSEEERFLQ